MLNPGAAPKVLALAITLSACRYQPTPVPLAGTAAQIAALEGSWNGEYWGSESGRTGSIAFTIAAGSDTAYGDVLMISSDNMRVRAADAESRMHATHSESADLLRVSFVSVSVGAVSGTLEPYVAPDCRCVVSTAFRGVVSGNTIEGDYLTRGESGLHQTGRWKVTRQRAR